MTIPLTGTGGLFTRTGAIGRVLLEVNRHQAGLSAHLDGVFDQYDGDDRLITPTALTVAADMPAYPAQGLPALADLFVRVLVRMVALDNQAASGSVYDAVREVIRQMEASGDTVERCTCTATATALGTNSGTGRVVTTVVRGDGVPLENCIPENARLVCVADSYLQTATAGLETFRWVGEFGSPAAVFAWDWPQGSGVAVDFSAIDAATGPDQAANVLTNGGFEEWTGSVPDDWTVDIGSVTEETSTVFAGDACLRVAGGATLTAISQTFAGVIPYPLTGYAFNAWVRVSNTPAAGVLAVDLVDSTGAVVADAEGAANSFSVALTGLAAATWTGIDGVFRLPRAVPNGLKIRLRLTTALSSGVNLYLDSAALAAVTQCYPGGPGVAVFAGGVPWARDDAFTVAVTNDRAGATLNACFQALFDRMLATVVENGMRGLGLQLPSSQSAPTIPDSLLGGGDVYPWSLDFTQPLNSMYLPIL